MPYVFTMSYKTLNTINNMLHGHEITEQDRKDALEAIKSTDIIMLQDNDFKGLDKIIQNVRKIENKV